MEKNQKTVGTKANNESATGVQTNGTTAEVTNKIVKMEQPKAIKEAIAVIPSIEELQAKAEKTAQLVERFRTIKAKKAEVDSFVILHENTQAEITVRDVAGRSITTCNPKTIAQVIEFWKGELTDALQKSERDIREIMNAQQALPEVLKDAV